MEQSHYNTLASVESKHWWFIAKRALVVKMIPKNSKEILDVGAGTGAFVKYLIERGYRATGIEPSQMGLKYATKSRLPVVYGSSHKIPSRDNQYDCVTCIDVLYHKNVKVSESLSEMMRVLKPSGTLIIFDCAYNWLRGPHDLEVHARERFTKNKLVRYISQTNGRVVYASYFYFWLWPLILLRRLFEKWTGSHEPIKTPNKIVNYGLKVVTKLESWTMPSLQYPWGSSIIVVVRK